jgi:hypothetical protein
MLYDNVTFSHFLIIFYHLSIPFDLVVTHHHRPKEEPKEDRRMQISFSGRGRDILLQQEQQQK